MTIRGLERIRRGIQFVLAAACLAGGVGLMVGMIRSKPAAPIRSDTAKIPEVEVVIAKPRVEATPIVGYGTVRPKTLVQIVPQVSGRIIEVHRDLALGKIIPKGELLFAIDPTVYEARVRQAESEVTALESALGRHDREEAALQERLANAETMLSIDEADHLTAKRLFEEDDIGTRREVDLVLQKLLKAKDALAELKNLLARIPDLRVEAQAQLTAAQARRDLAKFELQNTRIHCPFRARVEAVGGFAAQVVPAFTPIATLTDLEAFEISVGVDPAQIRWLHPAVRPEALTSGETRDAPPVTITWSGQDRRYTWPGSVTRFERFEELTRAARMIVEVRPGQARDGRHSSETDDLPAPAIGMFCRVEFPAEPLAEALLIPRAAVQEDRWVYVVAAGEGNGQAGVGRLERREITAFRNIGEEILVDFRGRFPHTPCELRSGERVVVSPLLKPSLGAQIRAGTGQVQSRSSPSPARVTTTERQPGGTQ